MKTVSHLGTAAEARAIAGLNRTSDRLARIADHLERDFATIRDGIAGMVGGRAPDAPPSNPSPWCWTHQQQSKDCDARDQTCRLERLTKNDPTGEAATNHDPHRETHRRVLHLEAQLDRTTTQLEDALREYQETKVRPPTPKDLTALRAENALADPALHCRLCAEVPPPGQHAGHWLQPMHRNSTVSNILDTPMPLCHGHLRHVGIVRRRSTPEETAHWQANGKWPPTYEPKGKSA